MIDPQNITNFNRTKAELEEFLLFCICVQGKNATIQAKKLDDFLTYLAFWTGCGESPFMMVNIATNYEFETADDEEKEDTMLFKAMKAFGLGQYNRIARAIDDLLKLGDLRTVTVEELEKCFAVGPKTARFFVVHSRPNQNHAILDTHVLKWLTAQGVINVPRTTPQGKWYFFFEQIFLTKVRESGKTVAEFDLDIWKSFASVA